MLEQPHGRIGSKLEGETPTTRLRMNKRSNIHAVRHAGPLGLGCAAVHAARVSGNLGNALQGVEVGREAGRWFGMSSSRLRYDKYHHACFSVAASRSQSAAVLYRAEVVRGSCGSTGWRLPRLDGDIRLIWISHDCMLPNNQSEQIKNEPRPGLLDTYAPAICSTSVRLHSCRLVYERWV